MQLGWRVVAGVAAETSAGSPIWPESPVGNVRVRPAGRAPAGQVMACYSFSTAGQFLSALSMFASRSSSHCSMILLL